jgi:hypothetical protein
MSHSFKRETDPEYILFVESVRASQWNFVEEFRLPIALFYFSLFSHHQRNSTFHPECSPKFPDYRLSESNGNDNKADNRGGNAVVKVQIFLETALGLCSPSDKIMDAVNAFHKKKKKSLNRALRELML